MEEQTIELYENITVAIPEAEEAEAPTETPDAEEEVEVPPEAPEDAVAQ